MDNSKQIMHKFIGENQKLTLDFHPQDFDFLIIRNITLEKAHKLCEKYHASGIPVGKDNKDFTIGNFGKY